MYQLEDLSWLRLKSSVLESTLRIVQYIILHLSLSLGSICVHAMRLLVRPCRVVGSCFWRTEYIRKVVDGTPFFPRCGGPTFPLGVGGFGKKPGMSPRVARIVERLSSLRGAVVFGELLAASGVEDAEDEAISMGQLGDP